MHSSRWKHVEVHSRAPCLLLTVACRVRAGKPTAMVPLLRIERAVQLIPQLIPQHLQTRPAPANMTGDIDTRSTPSAPALADAANAQIHRL
jgi:hypothetical protein